MLQNIAWTGSVSIVATELYLDSNIYVASGQITLPQSPTCREVSETITDVLRSDSYCFSTWTTKNTITSYSSIQLTWQLSQILPYPTRSIMTLFQIQDSDGQTSIDAEVTISGTQIAYYPINGGYNSVYYIPNSSLSDHNLGQNQEFVVEFDSIMVLSWSIQMDKLFVIREYSLNQFFADPVAQFYDFYQYLNLMSNDSKWLNTFSDHDTTTCPPLSFGGSSAVQFYQDFRQQPFKMLVTSVFTQMGPLNYRDFTWYINTMYFNVASQSWVHDQAKHFNIIYDSKASGKTTGNILHDFATDPLYLGPVVIESSNMIFASSNTNAQICTLQWFGWPYCQVDAGNPFTQATIKIRPDETKDIIIGTLNTYYDPDLKLQNNPFCYLGWQTILFSNFSPVTYLTNYIIDPVTFTITILKFNLLNWFLLDQWGQQVLQMGFGVDTRQSYSGLPAYSTQIAITVANYCVVKILQYASTIALDSPFVSPAQADFYFEAHFYLGMGVVKIQLSATADCEGFLPDATTFQFINNQPNTLFVTTLSEFKACQTQIATEYICSYLDTTTNYLYFYSNPEELSISCSFTITPTLSGYDSSDSLITKDSYNIVSLVVKFDVLVDCETTTISAPSNTFPLTINLNSNQMTPYQQLILFKDSVGDAAVSNDVCGQRKFTFAAKQDDVNYELAKSLLDCNAKSHICVSAQDSLYLLIEAVVSSQEYAGKTFRYQLKAALKFYSAPSVTYNVNVVVQSNGDPVQATQFYSFVESDTYTYYIGLLNDPLDLKKFYFVGGSGQLASIEVLQTVGDLPSNSFQVEQETFSFVISTKDLRFDNSVSVFSFCAYLSVLRFDCSLTITVYFKQASEAQKLAQRTIHNTPPVFSQQIGTPDSIPCFGFDDASKWSFTFPTAIDKEGDKISYAAKCSDRQIFALSVSDDTLTLNLATGQNELKSETLLCLVTLTDELGSKSTYPVVFQSSCQQAIRQNGLELPVPTIRNITSSGEILILWNVDLRIQSPSNHRLLQSNHSDQKCLNSALEIKILPGNGSLFSPNRVLLFNYSVSQLSSKKTSIHLNFSRPADISTETIPDLITISFLNQSCFTSVHGIQVNASKVLKHKLPRQKTGGVLQTPSFIQSVVQSVARIAAFVLIMNFFLKGALNNLLSSIKSLGVLFHMFLVTLNYPMEMLKFFGMLFPLITFDALPMDSIYERIFHFSEITTDRALTDQFDNSGYTSIFIINNIGSILVFSILQILICGLLWFIRRFKVLRRNKLVQAKLDQVAGDTLWNGLINFYSENYLLFSVVSFIESNNMRFGSQFTFTENFCSFIAIVGMTVSVAFPLLILLLYKQKTDYSDPQLDRIKKILDFLPIKLRGTLAERKIVNDLRHEQNLQAKLLQSKQHKEFMSTYGILISGLRLQRLGRRIVILTPFIDILMKLVIAVSVTRLVNWPVFTIFLFNFSILFVTEFLLYFSPYQNKREQITVSFNAITFLALNYHLFLFTRYTDASMYPHIANSVIYLFWLCIGANILLTFPPYMLSIIQQLVKHYQFYKQRSEQFQKAKTARAHYDLKVVRQQEEILNDIENRNWQIQLTKGETINRKSKIKVKRAAQTNVDQLCSISERSEKSSDISQTPRRQQTVRNHDSKINQQIVEDSRKHLKEQKVNDSIIKSDKKLLPKKSGNKSKVSASKEAKVTGENVQVKYSEDKDLQIQLDPPITRQYADDFLPGQFKALKQKYSQQDFLQGKEEKSYRLFDTRDSTVLMSIVTLMSFLPKIKWIDFPHGTNRGNDSKAHRQSNKKELQAKETDFHLILTAKQILTHEVVKVQEYFTIFKNQTRRTFKLFVNDSIEVQFSEHVSKQNDQDLKEKLTTLVQRFQLGVTPYQYDMAVTGEIDKKLEWYAEYCNQSTYQDMDGVVRDILEQSPLYLYEYSPKMTLPQKILLYEHILCWLNEQQIRRDPRQKIMASCCDEMATTKKWFEQSDRGIKPTHK